MSNAETYAQEAARYAQLRNEFGTRNKAAIFNLLSKTAISHVHVEFNGEGDSGQIEYVTAIENGKSIPLPEAILTIQRVSWGKTEPVMSEYSLRDAIETLCYDYLADEHGGWENNDGAFGIFYFDVKERIVQLEFNARCIEIDTSEHTF